MSVVGFDSAESFDRAARATERVERWAGSSEPPPGRRGRDSSPLFVKVTGAATDGYYPGVVAYWDSEAEAWADTTDSCQVRANNGEALTSGKRYGGRVSGANSDIPLVIVTAPGPPPPPVTVDGSTTVAEVISSAGDPPDHTVQPKGLTAAGEVLDATEDPVAGVFGYAGETFPAGTPLALVEADDASFGYPISAASETLPGYVSITSQDFAGDKTFANDLTVEGYTTLDATQIAGGAGGAGIENYAGTPLRVGAAMVVGGAHAAVIAARNWSTDDYLYMNDSGIGINSADGVMIEQTTGVLDAGGEQGYMRVRYDGTNYPGGNLNPGGGGGPQFVGGIYVGGLTGASATIPLPGGGSLTVEGGIITGVSPPIVPIPAVACGTCEISSTSSEIYVEFDDGTGSVGLTLVGATIADALVYSGAISYNVPVGGQGSGEVGTGYRPCEIRLTCDPPNLVFSVIDHLGGDVVVAGPFPVPCDPCGGSPFTDGNGYGYATTYPDRADEC